MKTQKIKAENILIGDKMIASLWNGAPTEVTITSVKKMPKTVKIGVIWPGHKFESYLTFRNEATIQIK